MDVFEPNLTALLIFAAAWTACCAGAIHLAGMLPFSAAPDAVRSPGGAVLVVLNGALLLTLFALTLVYGYHELRWSSAVVTGGAIFLFAPFITQDLPERVKDGKGSLVALVFILGAALGVLFLSGAPSAILAL